MPPVQLTQVDLWVTWNAVAVEGWPGLFVDLTAS
jgi:hypothetical protein